MRKQDFLLQLIKSLSPTERRYFTLYCQGQGDDKKYLQLFEALLNEKEYNASRLATQLSLSSGQLAAQKHYLSQVLLNSLRCYGAQNNEIDTLYSNLEEARLLRNRHLFDYALDIIEKTMAKAWEYERFELIGGLWSVKSVCLYNLGRSDESATEADDYKRSVKAFSEIIELKKLVNEIAKAERSRRDPKYWAKKYLRHPMMQKKPETLLSLIATVNWFDVMFKCCFLIAGNSQKAREVALHEWNHYAANPLIKIIDPVAYLVSYTRVANAEYISGNYQATLKQCLRLDTAIADVSLHVGEHIVESISVYNKSFTLDVLFMLGQFQEALRLADKLESAIRQRNVYEQLAVFFRRATILIHLGKSKEAVDYLDELFKLNTTVRSDLQQYLRPLMLMAQIDLGNYQLLPYLIKSYKSWMKRQGFSSAEFELFFKLVLPLSRQALSDHKKVYLKLLEAINEKRFPNTDGYVLLKLWTEKKIKGKG